MDWKETRKRLLDLLPGRYLPEAWQFGIDLRGVDLRDADLSGAYGAYLRGADLSGADLRGVDLRDVDLRDADLRGADLRGADLRDATINWMSHDLIAELLRQAAGNDVDKQKIAGLVLISRDWCWDQFLALDDPLTGWALDVLALYVKDDDNAPNQLRAIAEQRKESADVEQ